MRAYYDLVRIFDRPDGTETRIHLDRGNMKELYNAAIKWFETDTLYHISLDYDGKKIPLNLNTLCAVASGKSYKEKMICTIWNGETKNDKFKALNIVTTH